MNKKQTGFILGIAICALVLPLPFSVGMMLMGVSIGAWISIFLAD